MDEYRVFEPINKKMYYVDLALRTKDGNFILPFNNQSVKNNYCVMNLDNVIVEQFTGLKDKLGKKIYKGDILEIRYNNGQPPVTIKIVWSESQTGFSGYRISKNTDNAWSNWYSLSFSGSVVDGLYIIGNIHDE